MNIREIIGVATAVTMLLLIGSCTKADSVPVEVDLLQLIIMEQRDELGRYEVQLMEEGAKEPKPYFPIDRIEHFDQVYKEGAQYQIIVKRIREKGETRYIWTGKYWGSNVDA